MQRSKSMERAIQHLGDEIQKIRRIIDDVQMQLELLEHPRRRDAKLMRLTERLKEAHTRLEGLEQYVVECKIHASRDLPDEEEIDLWL